ncbi:MAG: protein-(glutamine-N5) methyltransferase, release factor-specific [Colwellia sp.]|nr:MAG: protein-(glutamine-N5) methyltransferase, release factor-specific [Colwellia sp.]
MHFRLVGDNSIANLTAQGQQLLAINSDSAKLDVDILLSLVLNKARSYLLTWPEKKLSDKQLLEFINLLARRAQGEPIAYITGVKEFWSLPFAVSPATLIPRPDTETLVELVLELYSDSTSLTCLDLGTGTGAIALALASENSTWKIDAIDFNLEAVKLAQRNAKSLNLSQVDIYQSDWFLGIAKNKTFDVIVSNPPYIDGDDVNLSQGDVRFEPKSALIANEQGLADIKHIADKARHFLNSGGTLFFEHGFEQGHKVRTILTDLGYNNVQTRQDLNGHERISWAIYANF